MSELGLLWHYKTPGIPDEEFDRADEIPITKEEIRALQISKARLSQGQVVYDLGCGSGSISVEAALQVESSGKVYAVDSDSKAVDLTKRNLEKFGITNAIVILGDAKEKIIDLPEPDAIFIGGMGGDSSEILEQSHKKLKSGGRIVIGVILIETLFSVITLMKKLNFTSVDITQITISKSRKTSSGTMMLARNPVTIISATKG